MPDGTAQAPGGWNRFSIEVPDLARMVSTLREAGVHFRNDIVTGVGGNQIIVVGGEDGAPHYQSFAQFESH